MAPVYPFPPRKILVPTDLGVESESALKYARYFHERFGSKVLVLHAHNIELPPYFSSGQLKDMKRQLKKLGEAAAKYVRTKSRPALGHTPEISVVESPPVEAILEASKGDEIDLVIMGMHGRHGLERIWLGSVTERVIRRSSLPILAVRHPPTGTSIEHLLCPISPSDTGRQALEYAAKFSKAIDARLTILHVVEQDGEPLTCPLAAEDIIKSCRVEEVNIHGNAARTIAESIKSLKPDLIVMGAESKSTVLGDFFSSTTSSIMQLAVGPLLVVPKR